MLRMSPSLIDDDFMLKSPRADVRKLIKMLRKINCRLSLKWSSVWLSELNSLWTLEWIVFFMQRPELMLKNWCLIPSQNISMTLQQSSNIFNWTFFFEPRCWKLNDGMISWLPRNRENMLAAFQKSKLFNFKILMFYAKLPKKGYVCFFL